MTINFLHAISNITSSASEQQNDPVKMSAAHLEDVRKRYKFKELNIAIWRDPSYSVHPARGGPTSPQTISATDAGRPYMPTYKYMINPPKPPEPTDDEESSSDDNDYDDEQGGRPAEPLSGPVDDGSAVVEEMPDPFAIVQEFSIPPLSADGPNDAEEPSQVIEDDQAILVPNEEVIDDVILVEPNAPGIEADGNATADIVQPGEPWIPDNNPAGDEGETEPLDVPPPAPESLVADDDSPPPPLDDIGDGLTAIEEVILLEPEVMPEAEPTEAVPGPIAEDADVPPPQDPVSDLDFDIPPLDTIADLVFDIPPPAPDPPPVESESIPDAVPELAWTTSDDASGESVDKKVTFAPGTPEPKPTQRKKRKDTGVKKKKKKIVSALDELPDDIVAIIDAAGDFFTPLPPVVEAMPIDAKVPADPSQETTEPDTAVTVVPEPEAIVVVVPEWTPDEAVVDVPADEAPAPIVEVIEVPATETPPPPPPVVDEPAAKPAKKASSKSSSKDKAKEKDGKKKKKSSSSSTTSKKAAAEEPSFGLGIDLLPPPPLVIETLPDAEAVTEVDAVDEVIAEALPAAQEASAPPEIENAVPPEVNPPAETEAPHEELVPPTDKNGASEDFLSDLAIAVLTDGPGQAPGNTEGTADDHENAEPEDTVTKDDEVPDMSDALKVSDEPEIVESPAGTVSAVDSGVAFDETEAQAEADAAPGIVEESTVTLEAEDWEAAGDMFVDQALLSEVFDPGDDPSQAADEVALPSTEAADAEPDEAEVEDVSVATAQAAGDVEVDIPHDETSMTDAEAMERAMLEELATEQLLNEEDNVEGQSTEQSPPDQATADALPIVEASLDEPGPDEAKASSIDEGAPPLDDTVPEVAVEFEDAIPTEEPNGDAAPDEEQPATNVEISEILDNVAGSDDIPDAVASDSGAGVPETLDADSEGSPPPELDELPASTDVVVDDASLEKSAAADPEVDATPPLEISEPAVTEASEDMHDLAPDDSGPSIGESAQPEPVTAEPEPNTINAPAEEGQVSATDGSAADALADSPAETLEPVAEAVEPAAQDPLVEESVDTSKDIDDAPPPPSDPIPEAIEPVEAAVEPAPEAPPSPALSKGSAKRRSDAWARPAKKSSQSKDSKPRERSDSKRSSRPSTADSRTRSDRHPPRRLSMTADEEAERRRRRDARKAEEAARAAEELRKKLEEEEERRNRHEARRAARKAVIKEAEDIARRIAREEAEPEARKEAEARRRRRERKDSDVAKEKERDREREKEKEKTRDREREREQEKERHRSHRSERDRERTRDRGLPREPLPDLKPTRPSLLKAFSAAATGQSRTSAGLLRSSSDRGDDLRRKTTRDSYYRSSPLMEDKVPRMSSDHGSRRSHRSSQPVREEVPPAPTSASKDETPVPESPSSHRSHRRRHESRGEGEREKDRERERPYRSRRESERRERRPTLEEKAKKSSFMGSFFRAFK